ncbi:MAG: diguanylate cyclase [Gammaproteobacteria bacterium]|nr:diguanylate cyclase [Gammaproteobacteria bacterium]
MIYLPAAAILSIAIVTSLHLDAQDRIDRAKVREAARIEIAKNLVTHDFSSVASDLQLLAATPALHHYLDGDNRAGRADDLANLFLEMARAKGCYDQVRYLDATGREIIRINFNAGSPSIVPRAQLQDKSERYFFRDSYKLERNEIFVSPMDLNVEHDQLEIPYKPMIRFGTPVFDSAGRKRGIILLNYFGEKLLGHFREAMRGSDASSGMLLNRDGYWLNSARSEDEWGFMLGKPERRFGQDHAAEWSAISAGESGALQTEKGLYVYATVYPLLAGQRSSTGSPLPRSSSQQELTASEYKWKIVSFTSDEELAGSSANNRTARSILFGVIYLLLAFGSLAIAYFRLSRMLAQSRLKEDEARLREITTTMSDGLLVTDHNGQITFANPEAGLLLGYNDHELLGRDMHGLLHVREDGSSCNRADCKLLQVVKTGTTYRGMEEFFRCKNGQALPISVSVSAIIKEQKAAGIVVAFHDITERKKFELELERQAQIDALTGLNNRRHFYELAEQEIVRTRRYGKPLSILMVDVDHFKSINDTYGHHSGDTVLQRLSDVCRQTMREIDIIGRIGGEEFCILLPEANGAQAREAAERLREAVAATEVQLEPEVSISFSVSIGVAALVAEDDGVAAMLRRADAALYAAKYSGRNRVCVQE